MPKPMIESHPLVWPDGWNRTPSHLRNRNYRYRMSFAAARDELLEELRLLTGDTGNVVISTNVPVKHNGLPYSPTNGIKEPSDPGVSCYWWDYEAKVDRVIACDAWQLVRENMRAVAMAIDALRMLQRCKASEILDRAFRGFVALTDGNEPWWIVFGFESGNNHTKEEIQTKFKELALIHHPDRGGDQTNMSRINKAYTRALEVFNL